MMENIENTEDIYFVEIKNNKCFKGVYVNKAVILEKESIYEEKESIYEKYGYTKTDKLIDAIKKLNIDTEFKIHLLKSEFEIFRLKSELKDLKLDFELLKHELLGAENNDIDEDMDEDDLFKQFSFLLICDKIIL